MCTGSWAQAAGPTRPLAAALPQAQLPKAQGAAGLPPLGGHWSSGLRRFGVVDAAHAVPPKVLLHGSPDDTEFCMDAVVAHEQAGQWEHILGMLPKVPRRGAVLLRVYNCAISACGRAERWARAWEKALALLVALQQQWLRPTFFTYTAILHQLPIGSWQLALGLLQEMQRTGLQHQSRMYSRTMKICHRSSPRQWERAMQVFAAALDTGFSSDDRLYTELIMSCIPPGPGYSTYSRRWQKGLWVFFEEMKTKGIEASEFSLLAAMVNCKAYDWFRALHWLRTMPQRNLVPGEDHITTAIANCQLSRERRWTIGLCLLKEMARDTVERDAWTYAKVMRGLCCVRQWAAALDCFSQVTPTTDTYNCAILACSERRDWARALALWYEMQSRQLAPNWNSYTALLKVAEESRMWAWSRQLLDTLHNLDAPRNIVMYNAALNACSRSKRWVLALALLREMREDSVTMNLMTYKHVVDTLESAGQFDLAMQIMEEADSMD